jgi:hypothetical protein
MLTGANAAWVPGQFIRMGELGQREKREARDESHASFHSATA